MTLARIVVVLLRVGVLLAASTFANADHVPGHDDCDPTFPVPLPDQQTYSGGIIFLTAIGPFAETQILETVINVKYISDGATPAEELLFNISVPVDGKQRELVLTGAELGFGEGPGTFRGRLATHFFDGQVWLNSPGPSSIVEIGIGAVNGGVEGTAYFVNSSITFKLGLRVDGDTPTHVRYPSPFDVASGLLSELRSSGQYFGAVCLGSFHVPIGTDPFTDPAPGDGRYYLARNLGLCVAQGYGSSSIDPDPRAWLNANPPCP